MEIPQLFKDYVGGIVRWALTGVLGHLAAKGIITGDMGAATIVWASGALATLAWSLWQKYTVAQVIAKLKGGDPNGV